MHTSVDAFGFRTAVGHTCNDVFIAMLKFLVNRNQALDAARSAETRR